RFQEGRPITARPVGALGRGWRWCRRHPGSAALLGTVAAMLLLLVVGTSLAAVWLKEERDAARDAERRMSDAQKKRLQELFRAYLNDSRSSRLTGRIGQRLDGVRALRNILDAVPRDHLSADQIQELRDELAACLA